MLKSLTVWNFALLEHVQVEFQPGLNILTGETGAGKSILIDSLGAVLGARMSADMVRSGCDWLRVEAVFSLEDESLGLHELLTQQAIDDSDKELIITRQLTRAGRSTALVNGCHVTLAVLRQIGAYLVDIHGQNENLALLKEENQFHLLDGYDPDVSEALAAYECVYREWREKKKAYAEKQQASREYAQRLDMLHWQDKEISEANLKAGEDEALETEIRKLSHAEKIVGSIEESYELLEGGGGSGLGVLPALSQVKKDLEDISRFDDALANAQKMVEEAYISLQVLLLAIMFLAILVEVKTGGTGAGIIFGLVAAVVFWGSQYVKGAADLFQIGLFLGGILCIVVEMLLPTVGLLAGVGVAAMLYSLVMALGGNLAAVAVLIFALVAAVGVFALIVNQLPSSRLWKRFVLKDQSTAKRGYVSAVEEAGLVGEQGPVLTELRPSGSALLEGHPVDVVSEGAFIAKGELVRVISVQGSRVVVRRVEKLPKEAAK